MDPIKINTNNSAHPVRPSGKGGKFTFEELYSIIGNNCDTVQIFPLNQHYCMVMDEDGHPKELPLNGLASNILNSFLATQGIHPTEVVPVVGNVVLCELKDIRT